MEFQVRVRDPKGSVKYAKVQAPNEAKLRAGLEKRGFQLLSCRAAPEPNAAESHEPQSNTESSTSSSPKTDGVPKTDAGASTEEHGSASRGSSQDENLSQSAESTDSRQWDEASVGQAMSRFETLLIKTDSGDHAAALSEYVHAAILPVPELHNPAFAIIGKNALRQILLGWTSERVHGAMADQCGMPDGLARAILGFTLIIGKIGLVVGEGKTTRDQAIEYLLEITPDSEAELIPLLFDSCLTHLVDIDDREATLERLNEFQAEYESRESR